MTTYEKGDLALGDRVTFWHEKRQERMEGTVVELDVEGIPDVDECGELVTNRSYVTVFVPDYSTYGPQSGSVPGTVLVWPEYIEQVEHADALVRLVRFAEAHGANVAHYRTYESWRKTLADPDYHFWPEAYHALRAEAKAALLAILDKQPV